MFLIIDNYDSFVHNLARYFEIAGVETCVVRNDQITLQEIENMAPEAIVLSPGPCTPQEAGICIDIVKHFGNTTPVLGVCLGHQAIGEAYGGLTLRSAPIHGKSSHIEHNGTDIFTGLPTPLTVGRYHSLIVQLPKNSQLNVSACTAEGEIMAFTHSTHPVIGVQFHPESILTQNGQDMIENFVVFARTHNAQTQKAA